MKLTINKLIANDIINYAMDKTYGFNYSVTLSEYLEDYEEDSKKYILDNIDDIIADIEANENVADIVVEEKENDKELDMVFFWENLMTETEKIICDKSKELHIDLELDEIREISGDILDSDEFNQDIINRIDKLDKEIEI